MAGERALFLADELEKWIQLASEPAPETRCLEVNTDITMQEMDAWCEVEADMSPEELADSKEAARLEERLAELEEEERRLNDELVNLKARLKQEKAFNHQQNQAHQQQVRKLQQALKKRKKEAEAKELLRRQEEAKVQQEKDDREREGAKLKQQLQQARELNEKLKEKLQEAGGEKSRGKEKDLRNEIYMLNEALKDERKKEQGLHIQLEMVDEEETKILKETKQCKATLQLLTQQAGVLKQMVSVSTAELEGWSEQVERLQLRKQEARDTAKERQVMEKCAKKYQRRQQGLPDEKDSEGKTVPSNPSCSRTSSRSTGLSLKETSVTIFGKGTVKKSVVEFDKKL